MIWFSVALAQQTLTVPGDYATIQEAVDNAVDGDAIALGPGTFVEDVQSTVRLEVFGAGIDDTTWVSTTFPALHTTRELVLSELTVTGASGVFVDGIGLSDVEVHDVRFSAVEQLPLTITDSTNTDMPDVAKLERLQSLGNGRTYAVGWVQAYADDVLVSDSSFVDNQSTSSVGALVVSGDVVRIERNTFLNNDGDGMGVYQVGATELTVDNNLFDGNTADATISSDVPSVTWINNRHARQTYPSTTPALLFLAEGVLIANSTFDQSNPVQVDGANVAMINTAFREGQGEHGIEVVNGRHVDFINNLFCAAGTTSGLDAEVTTALTNRLQSNLFTQHPTAARLWSVPGVPSNISANIWWNNDFGLDLAGGDFMPGSGSNYWFANAFADVVNVPGGYAFANDTVAVDPGFGPVDCSSFTGFPTPEPAASDGAGLVDIFASTDADGDNSCPSWACSGGLVPGDCDDDDPGRSPLAAEVPVDGIDQDCDGFELCGKDRDLDGFGNEGSLGDGDLACAREGVSAVLGDCEDTLPTVFPGADEACDGVDSDCDGSPLGVELDPDEDGFLACSVFVDLGLGLGGDDCDDTDPQSYPGASEISDDGIDQDCDGADLQSCPLEACGGDLVGAWRTPSDGNGTCVGFVWSEHVCGPENVEVLDATTDGFLEFRDDGRFAYERTITQTLQLTYPVGCVDPAPASCDELPGTCTGDPQTTGCTCIEEVVDPQSETGDWVAGPTSYSLIPDSNPADPERFDHCRIDDTLTFRAVEGGWSFTVEACPEAFRDADGDGFGNPLFPGEQQCTLQPGYVYDGTDCNDSDPDANPDEPELPGNNVDEDCNGSVLCYLDSDGDGFATGAVGPFPGNSCEVPGAATQEDLDQGVDCDDDDPGVGGGSDWFPDCDGDGAFSSWNLRTTCSGGPPAGGAGGVCDDGQAPDGGWTDQPPAEGADDCDDEDAARFPGATEIDGDGVDQDCDLSDQVCVTEGCPTTDEAFEGTWEIVTSCPDAFSFCPTGLPFGGTRFVDGRLEIVHAGPGAHDFTYQAVNGISGGPACVDQVQCDDWLPYADDCTVQPDGGCECTTSTVIDMGSFIVDPTDPTRVLADGGPETGDTGDGTPTELARCVDGDELTIAIRDPGDEPLTLTLARCATRFRDADGDGYGDADSEQVICPSEDGPAWVEDGTDCDDDRAAVNPSATERCNGIDDDCDPANDLDGDLDGDRFVACTPDGPWLGDEEPVGGGDCDDDEPTVNPGAFDEVAGDGVDQDCDGQELCWQDLDGDGVGGVLVETADLDCTGGFATSGGDCDETDPGIAPGTAEVPLDGVDQDCDGADACFADLDGDGAGSTDLLPCGPQTTDNDDDCDDLDPGSSPGTAEVCDGRDNDCDGLIDNNLPGQSTSAYYPDADGDGWGEQGATPIIACAAPPATALQAGDCADDDPTIHPGATELCSDTADRNCDGLLLPCTGSDADGDGFCDGDASVCGASPGGDCDDGDASIFPGAAEVCDGRDQDCNGLADEGLGVDDDGDGFDRADTVCGTEPDCDDTDPTRSPLAIERCNGLDDDCDGRRDEGLVVDVDGDGWPSSDSCLPAQAATDCNDFDPDIHPGATEDLGTTDIDEDCDGYAGATPTDADGDGDTYCAGGGRDLDGDGLCSGPLDDPSAEADCDDDDPTVFPGATEAIDGVDNDCDGVLDNPVAGTPEDLDGDGYTWPDDCDERNPDVHAGAVEACDGLDTDCDGQLPVDEIDWDDDGFLACRFDCDDFDAGIWPGAVEDCGNGIDDNCDGIVDGDANGDGVAEPDEDINADGDWITVCNGDCIDDPDFAEELTGDAGFAAEVHPGAGEVCDGWDNDCNGLVDEGFDLDGDGYLDCGRCPQLDPWDCDCDDTNPTVNPGARDLCDGFDRDCNDLTSGGDDLDSDGWSSCEGDCDDLRPDQFPNNTEVCDNADNDCDGLADEGFDVDLDGFKQCQSDCDDGDATVSPAAEEICGDGIDNDCDSTTPAPGECPDTALTGETGLPTSPTADTAPTADTRPLDTAPEPTETGTPPVDTVDSATPPVDPEATVDAGKDCGCQATGSSWAPWLLTLLPVLVRRRAC